jgi:hypothetical protein
VNFKKGKEKGMTKSEEDANEVKWGYRLAIVGLVLAIIFVATIGIFDKP